MAMEVDAGNVAGGAAPMEVEEESEDKKFLALMDNARDLEASNPEKAIAAYKAIIDNKEGIDDPLGKGRESAIYALCELFVSKEKAQDVVALSRDLRPLFTELPKAKTAKIVRTLIDMLELIPKSLDLQVEMCNDCISWCSVEKRTFLRQRVESKLAALLLASNKYDEALKLLAKLLQEVKKLDDKLLLVEIYLIETRVDYALKNIPKAKAALTASKTNANAIHCPPLLQADIDLWSGVVALWEKDWRTSFSYFYEAFEAFNAAQNEKKRSSKANREKAKKSLQYLVLSKIMQNSPKDVKMTVNSKNGLQYVSREIDALVAVANSLEERSLKKFESILQTYTAELREETVISHHLSDLNETLLEQNILRILEPFSHVEISHVAELIEMPAERTLQKLSEMILDEKLQGTLDQGVGVVVLFDSDSVRSTYENSLKTIRNTSETVDTLYEKAKELA